jgi:hypothetical protein
MHHHARSHIMSDTIWARSPGIDEMIPYVCSCTFSPRESGQNLKHAPVFNVTCSEWVCSAGSSHSVLQSAKPGTPLGDRRSSGILRTCICRHALDKLGNVIVTWRFAPLESQRLRDSEGRRLIVPRLIFALCLRLSRWNAQSPEQIMCVTLTHGEALHNGST